MKEIIYSGDSPFFEVSLGILSDKIIRIETTNDIVSVVYGIRSSLEPESILNLRPQISQLVQGLFGDGFQSFDTELYLIQGNVTKLVGFVKSRIPHLSGTPLLSSPHECVFLLFMILKAQLQYKSSLADGLFAVLSKANMGGFVNTAFAWAWWGFEWLVQHLDELNPTPRKLNFQIDVHDGSKRNLRKYFKKQIISTVDDFKIIGNNEFDFKDTQEKQFEKEMESIREHINNDILSPTFIEMFENQIPFLSSVVDTFLGSLKYSPMPNWPSESNLRTLFRDWSKITEDIIRPAKVARDSGFHIGKYTGLLEGEKFDTYSGMKRLVGWVCALLSIILTRCPYEYDSECKSDKQRFDLVTIPAGAIMGDKPRIPSEGVLQWFTYENGEVIKHTTNASQVVLRNDWILEFIPEVIPEPSLRSSLIDTRELRSADFIFKTAGMLIKGKFEFDIKPHHLKVHRFITI